MGKLVKRLTFRGALRDAMMDGMAPHEALEYACALNKPAYGRAIANSLFTGEPTPVRRLSRYNAMDAVASAFSKKAAEMTKLSNRHANLASSVPGPETNAMAAEHFGTAAMHYKNAHKAQAQGYDQAQVRKHVRRARQHEKQGRALAEGAPQNKRFTDFASGNKDAALRRIPLHAHGERTMHHDEHEGFAKLEHSLAHRKGVYDPAGLAAAIGRKKLGKKAFQRKAAAGH